MSTTKIEVTAVFYDHMGLISSETVSNPRYIESNREAGEWLDKLMASLSAEQREWLINYESAVAEADGVMAEHAYRQGVVDGIAMMAARKSTQPALTMA